MRTTSADVRGTYLDAANLALALVAQPEVEQRWCDSSTLAGMSVGHLASHLARSVLQVGWFLDADIPDGVLIGADRYFAGEELTDRESRRNIGVRERSVATAASGHAAVVHAARQALQLLNLRLGGEPRSRRLEAFGRLLLLDDYLRTRIVELLIHSDDLSLSVDLPLPPFADVATETAIGVLVGAARLRHGDLSVLRALSRRERDTKQALRVL